MLLCRSLSHPGWNDAIIKALTVSMYLSTLYLRSQQYNLMAYFTFVLVKQIVASYVYVYVLQNGISYVP